MKNIIVFFFVLFLPSVGFSWLDISNPYEDLYKKVSDLESVELYSSVAKLEAKYNAAKENEQSFANRVLGAAAMGAGGIGGMMLASGLAEKNAMEDALTDMTAYLETFRCDYAVGKSVKGGKTNVELPGATELVSLYSEYVMLANDLKKRKEQLGMKPGIESEPILNSANTGLYDDVSNGITGSVYMSLARALQNPDGEDAKKLAEQQEENTKKIKTGATVGGVGVAGGAIGNMIINRDKN